MTADRKDAYVAEFGRRENALLGHDRPWLAELRREAMARFAEVGFPGRKSEDWKYTSVTSLIERGFAAVGEFSASAEEAARAALAAAEGIAQDATVLVFVDGAFVRSVARLGGSDAEVGGLAELIAANGNQLGETLGRVVDLAGHGFAALNTAFVRDGAVVRIPAERCVATPIHLLFYSSRAGTEYMAHPRVLIVADSGSRSHVIEHYVGEPGGSGLANAVTEISLARDATLVHTKVQRESNGGFHVHRMAVRQGEGSSFRSHAIAFGARLSRTEIAVELAGEGADCSLYGLYAVGGDQHVDHHTMVDHRVPRTTSRQLYKGMLSGRSRGVFTGKVVVRPDAQGIAAEQTNKNLLLSEGAAVDTRPQLEIYADDVKCTHGAAIGRLDQESLFYMRQRGLDLDEARALLTYGFASEVLALVDDDGLRAALEKRLVARIGSAGEGIPA